MKFNLFSSPSMVGLDVQPDGVRLIQLKKSKNKFCIEQLAKVNLPSSIFLEGKIKQWDSLSPILTELVHQYGLKHQAAAICLSANLISMQHIELPAGMSERAIQAEIHAQVARDFPSMTEALCLDFIVKPHKNAGYSDVFFIVTRQEYLLQYVNCVNSSGLKVNVVDVDIYAMKRAVSYGLLPVPVNNAVQVILYVINHVASLIIIDHDDILFHQQWDIINAVDFQSQLKSHIQIFFSTFAHVIIQRAMVCADEPYLTWIKQAFKASWEWEVYTSNPFNQITFNSSIEENALSSDSVNFITACGLAMREVQPW